MLRILCCLLLALICAPAGAQDAPLARMKVTPDVIKFGLITM